MPFYRQNYQKSTARAEYAEDAVRDAFRCRDLRLAEAVGFPDRAPGYAAKSITEIGRRKALTWLKLAAESEGESAQIALEAANEIR